jgi:hypothetical protein
VGLPRWFLRRARPRPNRPRCIEFCAFDTSFTYSVFHTTAAMSSASSSAAANAGEGSGGAEEGVEITYVSYGGEQHLPLVMSLVDEELSEPYSIFTYRYFVYLWPQLTFLVRGPPLLYLPTPLPSIPLVSRRGRAGFDALLVLRLGWKRDGWRRRRSMPGMASAWGQSCARWGSIGVHSGATSPCSSSSSPTEGGE